MAFLIRQVRTYKDGDFSLLRAQLLVGGRKHQIRRHLDSVAHQVVGDPKYGKSRINRWLADEYGLARTFLHATRLQMRHPSSGEPLDIEDPLPAELTSFLSRFPP